MNQIEIAYRGHIAMLKQIFGGKEDSTVSAVDGKGVSSFMRGLKDKQERKTPRKKGK
jgi:hypothetical protein